MRFLWNSAALAFASAGGVAIVRGVKHAKRFMIGMMGMLLLSVSGLAADGTPGPQAVETSLFQPGKILLFSVLLLAWAVVVLWARRVMLEKIRKLAIEKTSAITSQRLRRVSSQTLVQIARGATRLLSVALIVAGLFVWATAVLDQVPKTHLLARQVEQVLWSKVEVLLMKGAAALPDLAVVAVIYFLTRLVHQVLGVYFKSVAEGEVESPLFDAVTADTTRRLVDIGIWVVAAIIAFPYLPGSETAAFRGISVLAGLMLTLGSTNVVSQFTSGLALIYGKAVRPGDFIEVGGAEGVVERIGLFACSLRTAQEEVVVLPHSQVSQGLKNLSRGAGSVRLVTSVTIGYDTPWRQVRDLLLSAAEKTEGVKSEPAPWVRQAVLDDFYVKYELLVSPENPAEKKRVLSRLHEAIQDAFHSAGVQIMSPHYLGDPATPKVPPGKPVSENR